MSAEEIEAARVFRKLAGYPPVTTTLGNVEFSDPVGMIRTQEITMSREGCSRRIEMSLKLYVPLDRKVRIIIIEE